MCVLSDIKSALILSFCLSAEGYIGDGAAVGVTCCVTAELRPRRVFSPFDSYIFRGLQMRDQKPGLGGPLLAFQTPIFLPFDREYLENDNSQSYICQLELNTSSTKAV